MTDGVVLKRSGIDANDRIRIDNLGLVYYDIDNSWSLGADDILLGSLVYTSSLAKTSGIFTQDPDNPSAFLFGANTSDQSKGLMVVFNENFLKGLSLDPPPPVIPEAVKPVASVMKESLEATLKTSSDITNYILANIAPAATFSSNTASVELSSGSQVNAILGGSADLAATGNASDNVLIGNDGSNILDGKLGNDIMIGGKGDDTYYADSLYDTVIELRGEGYDSLFASIDFELPDQLEKLVLLPPAIRGFGNSADNELIGNGLNNILYGYGGNDILDGQAGDDLLVGGFGNDVYVIDSLNDSVDERFNAGNDTVRIRVAGLGMYSLPKYVENAELEAGILFIVNGNELGNSVLGNELNNTLYGLRGDDYLSGRDGDDRLVGGLGNDYIDGGAGADDLAGGAGNDYYIVDQSADSVVELFFEGQDLIQATCSYALPANVECLILGGSANLEGHGNSLNNLIKGNEGDNILDGGMGADTLTGRAGADVFKLSSLSSFSLAAADHITDFQAGIDKIRIDSRVVGLAPTDAISFSSVRGVAALSNALRTSNAIVYDTSTGYIHWNQNGSSAGAGSGGIMAVLDNKSLLLASDLGLY